MYPITHLSLPLSLPAADLPGVYYNSPLSYLPGLTDSVVPGPVPPAQDHRLCGAGDLGR